MSSNLIEAQQELQHRKLQGKIIHNFPTLFKNHLCPNQRRDATIFT